MTTIYANRTGTSIEAAESMKPHAATVELEVLKHIWSRGIHGSTSDEAELALGLSHQCCSARFFGLAAKGEIEKSGEMRPTRSGRRAYVWVLSEHNKTPVNGSPAVA